MENVKTKVASFYEAFEKFLSYGGRSSITEDVVASFSELKEKGHISYDLPSRHWDGNWSHEYSGAHLYRIEEPTLFYVVRFWEETDDNREGRSKRTETTVFVPNENR